MTKLSLTEQETRCPHCLHMLSDTDTVSFPHTFQCPYCGFRDKPVYEMTVPFSLFEKLTKEQLVALEADLLWVNEIQAELDEIYDKWLNVVSYKLVSHKLVDLGYLAKSLGLYREWQRKNQQVQNPAVP